MSKHNRIKISYDVIKKSIDTHITMGAAAASLDIDIRTFKRLAVEYELYIADKSYPRKKYDIKDIFSGLHPQYPTSKLSKRLVSEGYKEYKCDICGIYSWCGNIISLELDHIDGNNRNHSLNNLRLLCPNCHSQTPTFKNKRGKKKN